MDPAAEADLLLRFVEEMDPHHAELIGFKVSVLGLHAVCGALNLALRNQSFSKATSAPFVESFLASAERVLKGRGLEAIAEAIAVTRDPANDRAFRSLHNVERPTN